MESLVLEPNSETLESTAPTFENQINYVHVIKSLASQETKLVHESSLVRVTKMIYNNVFNIARQRGPMGSETSIWPCLESSNHEIPHIYNHARYLELSRSQDP